MNLKKLNWGHGVVIALGSFILFILFMIFIFPNGQKNSELITDRYYEEELAYQEVIDAKNNADKLEEKPTYHQDRNGIGITFPSAYNNKNTEVSFYLYRTDDSNFDIKKDVELDGANRFVIPSKVLRKGSYTLKLYWTHADVKYEIDYDVEWT
ncbi:MAG: nitrogen fixation protein FixH [Chryseobacterium sp.]|nr:MAG: nitrogen fixation protein FixH [Chryseobacterium sp.]